MAHRNEWKKSQTTNAQLNDELYKLLANALKLYVTNPPHEKYNDVRLVTREILDNVYKHNDKVYVMSLEVSVSESHIVTVKIMHDGDYFDPFDPKNECHLLRSLNDLYDFKSKFIATESGRYVLNLKFDLSDINRSKNGTI